MPSTFMELGKQGKIYERMWIKNGQPLRCLKTKVDNILALAVTFFGTML